MRNPIENMFYAGSIAAPDTILVATDLTDTTDLLPHAIEQAKASHAALCLVHAIPQNETFVPESGAVPYIDLVTIAQDAREKMEELALQVRKHGVRCTTIVRHGHPAEVIADLAREVNAGRVMVRTHGRMGIKRLLLGSVTREILKEIDAPVCTIGPHCKPPSALHNILHPTALEPDCENTLRLAVGLAQYHHAELTLLHVLPKDAGVEPYLDPQYAFEKMESLLPSNDGTPCRMVHTQVASGDLGTEVLYAAEKTHASLIVLGVPPGSSFWQGGPAETAYSIVASAQCPVLSFRAPAHQTEKAANSLHDMRAAG